ncbi:MAG: hypothetical protein AB1798_17085, partial [Spirochaetota bacterium]
VKVFLKKQLGFIKQSRVFEKTVVRPEFGKRGKISISETAIIQMVLHCTEEFDHNIRIKKVTVKTTDYKYLLGVHILVPFGVQLAGNIHSLQEYIIESVERFTGIIIERVNITIDELTDV